MIIQKHKVEHEMLAKKNMRATVWCWSQKGKRGGRSEAQLVKMSSSVMFITNI